AVRGAGVGRPRRPGAGARRAGGGARPAPLAVAPDPRGAAVLGGPGAPGDALPVGGRGRQGDRGDLRRALSASARCRGVLVRSVRRVATQDTPEKGSSRGSTWTGSTTRR